MDPAADAVVSEALIGIEELLASIPVACLIPADIPAQPEGGRLRPLSRCREPRSVPPRRLPSPAPDAHTHSGQGEGLAHRFVADVLWLGFWLLKVEDRELEAGELNERLLLRGDEANTVSCPRG